MNENLSQKESEEIVDDINVLLEKTKERSKSKSMEIADYFYENLELLRSSFCYPLILFKSLVARGKLLYEGKELGKSKKFLKKNERELENWEQKVISFLEKVSNDDSIDKDILEIKEEFINIAADKTEDGKNDLQLALEKIEEFDNYVSDNLIIDVEFLMNECVNNFSETKNEVWNRIYSALIVQKNSILAVKNEILEMADDVKGNVKKINYKELKFSEQTVYSLDEIVAAYEKFIIFQMESTVFDKNWFLVTKETLDFYKTFSAKDMYYKMIEELACGDFTNQKISAVKVIDSKTFKTVDSFILKR